MPTYTIENLKDDLSRKLHGTSLSKIQGPLDLIYEAGRNVLQDCDPIETKRKAQIANALYDNVYDYTSPTDLKGNKIIDIRRQVNRLQSDNFSQNFNENFDLKKELTNNNFTIESRDSTKFFRIAKSITVGKTIHDMNSITGNGTWAVGGDTENLTQDTLNKVSGSASLNFDLDGSGTTGYIENSDFTDVDLSDHEDKSALFLWLYIPDTSIFTSCDLRWGSSSSAYWNVIVTSGHASVFQNGWNLLRFDWNGATKTGSPDSSAINYAKVTLTYDGTADTDFRVDNIISNLGDIFDVLYYSKYLFQNSSGTYIEKPTADTDLINLDTDSYNLLLIKTAEKASQQIQGEDNNFDFEVFRDEYESAVKDYNQKYPSEAIKTQIRYYRFGTERYRGRYNNLRR